MTVNVFLLVHRAQGVFFDEIQVRNFGLGFDYSASEVFTSALESADNCLQS